MANNMIKVDKRIIMIVLLLIIFMGSAYGLQIHSWNTESDYKSGVFNKAVQLNLDAINICDAKRYYWIGYDYPGLDVRSGVCQRCSDGNNITLYGGILRVPSGQDPFSDCNGIDCSGYYVQIGTEHPTADEHCYNRVNEPANTHDCTGLGSCQSAALVCPGNAANTWKYLCGTCKYIDSSNCVGTTLGSCTNYASGTDSGLCRECNGAGAEQAPADDTACGTIDCDGKNIYFTSGTASATGTNYCKYRNYADIITNRCEGLGNCKDANTADCTSYADSTAATCGTCCYASGACSSCSYYSSSTQGPTADHYYDNGADSPTGTNYCVLRNYHCTGNSCGETYGDSTVATCGTCKYCSGSSCTNYATGTDSGLCRQCNGAGGESVPSDDSGCGIIDCDGKNYYYTSGGASATGTNYCKYRNYADITTNRCEGLSNCKDANSADCTSYADSTAATCGTCKYATGACSTCTNYASGTSCGPGKECNGAGSCSYICISHSSYSCYGSHVYWYDSCGVREGIKQTCSHGCNSGVCRYQTLTALYCSDASIPAGWYKQHGGRCGERVGLDYWNNQILTRVTNGEESISDVFADFKIAYTNDCQSMFGISNYAICNDMALCHSGDDYITNSNWCYE